MKKSLFSWMIGAVVALSSCSQSDEIPTQPQTGDQLATFTVEAPALTRANTLSRYIVEAYEGEDFSKEPTRVESANGTLTITLKKNTSYAFLFWADNGAVNANTGYWDATNLQEVKVVSGKEGSTGEVAYCYKVAFNSKDFEANKTVTLKNATAQVSFIEKFGLPAADNTLTVKYAIGMKLDVSTGKVTEVPGEVTHTFTGIGKIPKDGTLATDYVLAPLSEKKVVNLTVKLNSETEKPINNVPFQQSYKTMIKGEYSIFNSYAFEVSEDATWKSPEVGDFYMNDGSWLPKTSTLTDAQKADCIGIVFVVNPDGSGKIVSLDEAKKPWSTENIEIGAKSKSDGAANTGKVLELPSYIRDKDTYPAFKWCAAKNPSGVGGIEWYIPANDELLVLMGVKDDVNTSLEKYSDSSNNIGMKSPGQYCSSTEEDYEYAYYYVFGRDIIQSGSKTNEGLVRAISAF